MKILWLQSSEAKLKSNYIKDILDTLQHQYDFHIVLSSDEPAQYGDKKNLIVVATSKVQNKLRTWLDNNLKYAPILKKWHIDKIVLAGTFLKVESILPQYLIVPHINFSIKEEDKSFVQNHNISFVTYGEKVKESILSICPNKAVTLYNPKVSELFRPLNWEESLEVKEMYSDGNDFFLVNSIGQNADYSVDILKGFSVFKKWQKSSMKILFISDNIQELQEKIANYKYRDDVRIINQPNEKELANVIAASYCTIHLPKEDGDNRFVLESVQCQIPVLLKKESTALTWLKDNAFYIDTFSTETLGQAFITMYKAENVRSHHIDYMEHNPIKTQQDGLENLMAAL